MTELKTKPTKDNVGQFLQNIADPQRRQDSIKLCEFMQKVTGKPPVLWGSSIIGFDSYHYKYPTGREADWLAVGFSPRKQALTIYIMDGFDDYKDVLDRLGTFTTSKGCLYVKRLDDIDLDVLQTIITKSVAKLKAA